MFLGPKDLGVLVARQHPLGLAHSNSLPQQVLLFFRLEIELVSKNIYFLEKL